MNRIVVVIIRTNSSPSNSNIESFGYVFLTSQSNRSSQSHSSISISASIHLRTVKTMLVPVLLAALAGTAAAIPTPQVEGDGITYGNWTVRADWSRKYYSIATSAITSGNSS